mmetsp:Transcript_777/g.967  ORF Transcript_777/g.967 Transcript_777/m.967 type:complete len:224 (-) Transcript_777:589-1260(-)
MKGDSLYFNALNAHKEISDEGKYNAVTADCDLVHDFVLHHPDYDSVELKQRIMKNITLSTSEVHPVEQSSFWVNTSLGEAIMCTDLQTANYFKIRLIVVDSEEQGNEVTGAEAQFHRMLKDQPKLGRVFGFVVNWFKMRLYDKNSSRDPFSTLEMKWMFEDFVAKRTVRVMDEGSIFKEFILFILSSPLATYSTMNKPASLVAAPRGFPQSIPQDLNATSTEA